MRARRWASSAAWEDMTAPPSRCGPLGDPHQRIAFHQGAEDCWPVGPDWHEQPQLPGDDLGDEAHRLEPVDHPVREPGDLDAKVSHDLDAANLKPVLEVQDRPPVEHGC